LNTWRKGSQSNIGVKDAEGEMIGRMRRGIDPMVVGVPRFRIGAAKFIFGVPAPDLESF
jgi:hypothetical protein